MSANEQKSKTVPKRRAEDRRAARTRRSIRQALIDLMHGVRFEDITVQDILDRADVGRSTFYAHYTDKEDAVRQMFEEMLESLTRGVAREEDSKEVSFPIGLMLRRLRDQRSAQGVWLNDRGREFLFSVGQAYWNRRIERELRAHQKGGGVPGIPYAVAAQMVTGAATALLNWWIKNKMPYTPEEMQKMFDRMMAPGFRGVLES
jgi:AcrR family transcriptional regulator